MQQAEIFAPFLALMLLTFMVWVYMYARRLHYIASARVDPQQFATRAKAMGFGPDSIQNPANNLQNLLELPVLFYALCLYLYAVAQVDAAHLWCAWIFVGLRAAHSLVQCTVNRVAWRFGFYLLGALVLWTMIMRAALALGPS